MEKTKSSAAPMSISRTPIKRVSNKQPSELTSLLGVSALITSNTNISTEENPYQTRGNISISYNTDFGLRREGGCTNGGPGLSFLLRLFSKLQIQDQVFLPLDPQIQDFASSKRSKSLETEFKLNTQPTGFWKDPRPRIVGNKVSGSLKTPASEKHMKLYRRLQLKQRNGSRPLTNFTLFQKLPPELRVKIWQFSFARRRFFVNSDDTSWWSGKNITRVPHPVQLSVNRESRAEVKLYYNFNLNWRAQAGYRGTCCKYANMIYAPCCGHFPPRFGIYYHAEIDELNMIVNSQTRFETPVYNYVPFQDSLYWNQFDAPYFATCFGSIETLVIREASWTTRADKLLNPMPPGTPFYKDGYAEFHHLREIVVYPVKVMSHNKADILHTELGRKQCCVFIMEMFKRAQRANPDITIRVPVITFRSD